MKAFRIAALVILFLFSGLLSTARSTTAGAVDSIPARAEDVGTPDALIKALYDVISGPAGQERSWDRMRTLFIPEGRLVSTGMTKEGVSRYRVMTVEDYIRLSGPLLVKNGFFETEISRKSESFGPIMHVFSTYQSKHKQEDAQPFARGINSIQLMHDGKRWWIVSVYWSSETEKHPIPAKYLQPGE